MDPSSQDPRFAAAAAAGDRDVLAQLLVEHSGALSRRLAAQLELNPFVDFTVEDVLQEVFLDVFRGIGTFRPDNETTFKAWLNKVADNRLASMLRRRSRAKRGGGRPPMGAAGDSPLKSSVHLLIQHLADSHGQTGSEHAARAEMIQALRKGLAALPDDQRAAVETHYLDDRSLDGTAEEMAKTQDAVRGLLHRAKKSLRKALGESSRWFYRR